MAKGPRHTPEQVIGKLREAEVKLAKGVAIAQVCKELAITENTYYRWCGGYGGMKFDQAGRLKDPEKENARLKRLLADAISWRTNATRSSDCSPSVRPPRRSGRTWRRSAAGCGRGLAKRAWRSGSGSCCC